MSQIRMLIENSERCWQTIEFKCFAAPLNINGNHHLGQWIDYRGKILTNLLQCELNSKHNLRHIIS